MLWHSLIKFIHDDQQIMLNKHFNNDQYFYGFHCQIFLRKQILEKTKDCILILFCEVFQILKESILYSIANS